MVLVGSKRPSAERRGRVDRQGAWAAAAAAAAAAGGRMARAREQFVFCLLPLSKFLSLSFLCCASRCLSVPFNRVRARRRRGLSFLVDSRVCAVAAGEGGGQVKSVTVYLETPGVEKVEASWCWCWTVCTLSFNGRRTDRLGGIDGLPRGYRWVASVRMAREWDLGRTGLG